MWQEASLVSWHLLSIGLGKGRMGCCLILAAGASAPCSGQPFLPSPEGPKGTTGWGVVPARSPHRPLPRRAAFRCAGPSRGLDPRLGKTSKADQGLGGSGGCKGASGKSPVQRAVVSVSQKVYRGTGETDEERFQAGIFQNVCPVCFFAFCKEMAEQTGGGPTSISAGYQLSWPCIVFFSERNESAGCKGKYTPPPA